MTDCWGACVDTTIDEAHCGGCGIECGPTQTCLSSICACDTGLVTCGDECADLSSDTTHCGDCGNDCSLVVLASSLIVAGCDDDDGNSSDPIAIEELPAEIAETWCREIDSCVGELAEMAAFMSLDNCEGRTT